MPFFFIQVEIGLLYYSMLKQAQFGYIFLKKNEFYII
jgi:hypothetical protein